MCQKFCYIRNVTPSSSLSDVYRLIQSQWSAGYLNSRTNSIWEFFSFSWGFRLRVLHQRSWFDCDMVRLVSGDIAHFMLLRFSMHLIVGTKRGSIVHLFPQPSRGENRNFGISSEDNGTDIFIKSYAIILGACLWGGHANWFPYRLDGDLIFRINSDTVTDRVIFIFTLRNCRYCFQNIPNIHEQSPSHCGFYKRIAYTYRVEVVAGAKVL